MVVSTMSELTVMEVYTSEEIVPIPAQCKGRRKGAPKHDWVDSNGNGAIRAPSLINCFCWYCGAELIPHPDYPPVIDARTRRMMQRSSVVVQLSLPSGGAA